MTWSFDLQSIPRDRNIIAETTKGEVMVTRFNKPTKTTPRGWFSMIGDESRIVAWQEMPAPSGRAATNSPSAAPTNNACSANTGGGHVTDGENAHPVAARGSVEKLLAACPIIEDVGSD